MLRDPHIARNFWNIICEIFCIDFLCVNWRVLVYHCLIFLHLRNHTKFIVPYSNVSICQRSFQMNPGFIFFCFHRFVWIRVMHIEITLQNVSRMNTKLVTHQHHQQKRRNFLKQNDKKYTFLRQELIMSYQKWVWVFPLAA